MRHTFIVSSLAACSLITAACMPQPRGLVAALPPPAAQPAAPAPFKVTTELDKAIWYMFQDSKGTYWFGSRGQGLYRWNGKGNAFDLFTTDSGLPHNEIGRIQEDGSGNLYINTGNGISKFDGRAFTTLRLDESAPAVSEVKLGPDVLWFAAGGEPPQALFYDGKSLRHLKIPTNADGDAFEARWPRATYPRRACPYDAYTIYTDTRGNVWFGTANLGAIRFDGKNFAWIGETELGFDEKDNRTFGTRSIMEDKDGKFWITVTKQRFDMNPSGLARQSAGGLSYISSPGLPSPKSGEDEGYTYIMSMTKDKAGDLWMATYGSGVWRYDGKDLKNFPVLVNGEPITLFSIYKDREDGLWLGTQEHGVFTFNGKAFEKFKF